VGPRRRNIALLRDRIPRASFARAGRGSARALGAYALAALCGCGGPPAHELSTQQLSQVVTAERPALQVCYNEALAKNPYRQDMHMQAIIEIAPSGRVSHVELSGGGGLPGMNACVRGAIARWRFPQAKDPTATVLPLVFHPEVKAPQPNLDMLREAFKQVGATPQTGP
jgi:hypothetical protein